MSIELLPASDDCPGGVRVGLEQGKGQRLQLKISWLLSIWSRWTWLWTYRFGLCSPSSQDPTKPKRKSSRSNSASPFQAFYSGGGGGSGGSESDEEGA